ncbi:INO80 complex subunit D-like isoform X1 [Zingiber officinale]|uniref:INO80 complex subunit D-like isoform X1 n=1 Tax=Zingiber officinale TaxID=94328 RepID=UPI001C4ADEB8|nr:INO80 complex subunit D-like isoform X1 [Zingiber officinale]
MWSAREGKAPRRSESIPNSNAAGAEATVVGPSAFAVDGAEEDECLRASASLSREEVLRRRSRRLKQLASLYRRQYWALMEEVRVKHRDYYWEHGVSPFVEDEEKEEGEDKEGATEENGEETEVARVRRRVQLGFDEGEGIVGNIRERKRCAFAGCKSKAMPLTRFCHPHILADKKQTLYKPCSFVTKSCGHSGPITCGKPVLRSSIPSLCHIHLQKSQRSISQALRKAGLNIYSTSKPAPKFSVLIAECVRQIQARRRALDSTILTMDQKDEIQSSYI